MKRQTVIHIHQKLSTSERRTCNVLGVARWIMTYQSKDRDGDALRIAKLLGNSGWKVNHKKVEQIWRKEGLQLPERHKRKRRLYHKDSSIIRVRPNRPNHG